MKASGNRNFRHNGQGASRRAERQLIAALRAQPRVGPEFFSDRDEDAAEVAAILRDFGRVHDETVSAERYN